jgi:beta-lactamase superfamily II metal-dependent hydrolase
MCRRALFLMLLICSSPTIADQVVPSDRVSGSVTIRAEATSNSAFLGRLSPGESLQWVRNVPRWREVQVSPGRTGFVSKSWTVQMPDVATATALPARAQDELRIHYLPVGAGSCTVVECPGSGAPPMIIDCGSFSAASRGPDDLDEDEAAARVHAILGNHTVQPNLMLSHADSDHYNYLDTILQGVQLDHVWLGDDSSEYPQAISDILETQEDGGATVHQDLPPDFHNNQFELEGGLCGDASVFILTVNSGSTKNGRSLVLSIDYGEFAAIFTGDAEGTTERQASQNYGDAIKATVLSGSHHGASTHDSNGEGEGNDWETDVSPEIMVYSSGHNYGHPRCSVTDNYHSTLATVPSHPMDCGEDNDDNTASPFNTTRAEYATEVNGTIVITTDGNSPLSIYCSRTASCNTVIAF